MEAGQHNKKKNLFIFLLIAVGMSISAAFAYAVFPKTIDNRVSFTSQAPLGEWDDPRQQDACEEAVALMAEAWLFQAPNYPAKIWRDKILAVSDFELEKYGEYRDASLPDIRDRIFKDYLAYPDVEIKRISSIDDIIKELEAGRLVLAPTNGQALGNPNFKPPGPERHIILIKGYDYEKEEFITNDPGTRKGANYRYSAEVLYEAIRPYKTGYHEPF